MEARAVALRKEKETLRLGTRKMDPNTSALSSPLDSRTLESNIQRLRLGKGSLALTRSPVPSKANALLSNHRIRHMAPYLG
jgi:hypothetical protein